MQEYKAGQRVTCKVLSVKDGKINASLKQVCFIIISINLSPHLVIQSDIDGTAFYTLDDIKVYVIS